MTRSDIADLLRSASKAMPREARSQFAKFIATLPGGRRSTRRKVHSWKRKKVPVPRPRRAVQGELSL